MSMETPVQRDVRERRAAEAGKELELSALHKALLSIAKGEAIVFSKDGDGLHIEVIRDRYIQIGKIISPVAAENAAWDIIAQHVNDGLKSVRDFDPTPDASGGWPVPKWMEQSIINCGK